MRPTLVMAPSYYKAGKLFSQLPESGAGDFNVVRATPAYRRNPSGILEQVASGVPRLDFPIGGGCPSLLDEPLATNLLPENLNIAGWQVVTNAVRADSGIASPIDGFNWGLATSNAGTFASQQTIYSGLILSLNNTKIYYGTAFFKQGTSRYIGVRTGGANYTEVIDFQTKTIYRTGGNTFNKVASRLIDHGDYLEFQTEATTTTTYAPFRVYFLKDPDVTIGTDGIPAAETFDGTETFLAQGAQFEVDRRTSLIQSGAAATTRNADDITVTPPAGTSLITTTFEDGSTNEIAPSGTFTIPQGRIKSIVMT